MLICMGSAWAFAQSVPPGTSNSMEGVFMECDALMNNSQYDSAFSILSNAYVNRLEDCSTIDRYYIHSLMSEILYYNALFVQGRVESEHSLAIAEVLGNDTLIASSENMLGLIHVNLGEYNQALPHFRNSLHHFPFEQANRFLAYRYHALANIGECFVKMQQADSALYYSELSRIEAERLNRYRGVAFALLNEAQVKEMRQDWDGARASLNLALQAVDTTNHRDVLQFLVAEQMKIALQTGVLDGLQNAFQIGLHEMESEWTTDYSRLEFLRTAGAVYTALGDKEIATDLLNRQVKLVEIIRSKQERNQAKMLRDYVHKSESLLYAAQLEESLVNAIFWRRLTIFIAGFLVLVCLIAAWYYLALNKRKGTLLALKREAEMQEELKRITIEGNQKSMDAIALERNRIASDLHDDLGASLSGINIYSSLALKPGLDEATRIKWVEKIKALSTQMNENMSDIVWSIYSVHDNWPSVVLRMQAYATEVLSLQNIDVRFDVDKNLHELTASLELRHHLMMCFKEAVINICKYSEAKHVRIQLKLEGAQNLELHIQDDGIGINADGEVLGNGLKNMKRRMAKLNGRLMVKSEPSNGTLLIFEIPDIQGNKHEQGA